LTIAFAVDTSIAVPLLVETHRLHHETLRWWDGRRGAERTRAGGNYSVITRLPATSGSLPRRSTAHRRTLRSTVVLPARIARSLPACWPGAASSRAVYDALIALAAKEHDVELATRDERAVAPTKRWAPRGHRAGGPT